MTTTVRAVYEHGAFVPEPPFGLPEGTEVVLAAGEAGRVRAPEAMSPDDRRQLLLELVERMKASPLPFDAPRLTRDQMHERR